MINMKTFDQWNNSWNELYLQYIKECDNLGLVGQELADYINPRMADYCEKLIIEAKDAYYKTGDTIMDDMTYDAFEGYLRILKPNSKWLKQVGSK